MDRTHAIFFSALGARRWRIARAIDLGIFIVDLPRGCFRPARAASSNVGVYKGSFRHFFFKYCVCLLTLSPGAFRALFGNIETDLPAERVEAVCVGYTRSDELRRLRNQKQFTVHEF
jgi:hypothetical protein